MILTQCPSCQTLFQAENEALESAGGAVRCGQCGAVFQALVYRINETTLAEAPPTRAARSRVLLPLAATLLAITLTAQILYATRDRLARIAFARPTVHAVCQYLPCDLPHPAALDAYRLSRPHVRLMTRTGVLSIRASLVNGASFRQSLPLLSVTLLAPGQTILARSTFPARVFLRHPRTSLGADGQAAVWLDLRIPSGASAYRLALFPAKKE